MVTKLRADFTSEVIPTNILANLLDTFWYERGGLLPKPVIKEIPIEGSPRIDLSDGNDHILIEMEDYIDELIHIGFKNRDITVPMKIVFEVSSNRRRLHEYVAEVRRIIHMNQHDPAVYLLESFENYEKDETKLVDWLGRSTQEAEHIKYTNLLLLDNEGIQSSPTYLRISSNTAFPILRASFKMPNFLNEDDFGSLYYDFLPRVKYLSFYARQGETSSTRTLRIFLRGGANNEKWNYDFKLTNYWQQFSMNIEDYINDITFTDATNDYYMDFHMLACRFDIDHLVLGSCDFQFLRFLGRFRPVPTTFNYWKGELRCEYRDMGRAIESFVI